MRMEIGEGQINGINRICERQNSRIGKYANRSGGLSKAVRESREFSRMNGSNRYELIKSLTTSFEF